MARSTPCSLPRLSSAVSLSLLRSLSKSHKLNRSQLLSINVGRAWTFSLIAQGKEGDGDDATRQAAGL
jgi:hypothetical protein